MATKKCRFVYSNKTGKGMCYCIKNGKKVLSPKDYCRSSSAKARCIPGTVKWVKGGRCVCLTQAGGGRRKYIETAICKRKYSKKGSR